VVEGIPPGHVLTYGEVARLAGMSRAARRVSQAMRRAPRGMKLPWHRVVNAQGKISFPPDSGGYRQQRERLESEGVVFLNGKIDLEKFGYRGALDHLLWADPSL
jgi:methylated-DNA-protein-cysteine methyltransferase-like protein